MIFNPSQSDVRRFFCTTARKGAAGEPLTPLESIALAWIDEHPEYRADLADEALALQADYPPQAGRENPFLHLSMHLAIAEQTLIDQPPGIGALIDSLAQRLGSRHEAHHEAMQCLGEVLWEAQRAGRPPDGALYVERLARRATDRR